MSRRWAVDMNPTDTPAVSFNARVMVAIEANTNGS